MINVCIRRIDTGDEIYLGQINPYKNIYKSISDTIIPIYLKWNKPDILSRSTSILQHQIYASNWAKRMEMEIITK